jgi:hypothetical protein
MNEELYGLLGLDPEKIRQQQVTQGLLGAGLQLLAGSGYSPVRRTTGELLGQAGAAGLQGYQQAGESAIDRALKGMQVKQMLERQQREKSFQESLRNAYRMAPSAQGVMATQSNIDPALLEGMSAEQVIGAAPKTERVLDQGKFMSALAEYSPLEYAKMAFKGENEPDQIRTLRALIKDPALLEAYAKLEAVKAPRSIVNVDTKNQAAMFKEIDIPIVQGFTTSATSAREFAQTSNTINNLLKGKGGGAMVQIGTEAARALGINPGQVSAADLAQSLVTQAAPRMRAPGSGSTSDMEFKAYMNALPSLASSEQGRQLMATYSTAFAERSAKLADYAKGLAAKNELSFEKIQAYDQSLGPILKDDFYKLAPIQTQQGGKRDFRNQK